ncbi:Homeobox protein tos8 [Marasmius tenuissimus]|uniref:Homeobox protein tos8 n=1 Tax=Marasmius tenuissimus TaxID=585030 RepID=A0ABR2ZFG0_9AGAR
MDLDWSLRHDGDPESDHEAKKNITAYDEDPLASTLIQPTPAVEAVSGEEKAELDREAAHASPFSTSRAPLVPLPSTSRSSSFSVNRGAFLPADSLHLCHPSSVQLVPPRQSEEFQDNTFQLDSVELPPILANPSSNGEPPGHHEVDVLSADSQGSSSSLPSLSTHLGVSSLDFRPPRKRGKLAKDTTELLKTWLQRHSDHPYPSEEEKVHLCRATGLSTSQVSNWMINARRMMLAPRGWAGDYPATHRGSFSESGLSPATPSIFTSPFSIQQAVATTSRNQQKAFGPDNTSPTLRAVTNSENSNSEDLFGGSHNFQPPKDVDTLSAYSTSSLNPPYYLVPPFTSTSSQTSNTAESCNSPESQTQGTLHNSWPTAEEEKCAKPYQSAAVVSQSIQRQGQRSISLYPLGSTQNTTTITPLWHSSSGKSDSSNGGTAEQVAIQSQLETLRQQQQALYRRESTYELVTPFNCEEWISESMGLSDALNSPGSLPSQPSSNPHPPHADGASMSPSLPLVTPLSVTKLTVTTGRSAKASHNRRKQEAIFRCPVPGCGSIFTRSFNLKAVTTAFQSEHILDFDQQSSRPLMSSPFNVSEDLNFSETNVNSPSIGLDDTPALRGVGMNASGGPLEQEESSTRVTQASVPVWRDEDIADFVAGDSEDSGRSSAQALSRRRLVLTAPSPQAMFVDPDLYNDRSDDDRSDDDRSDDDWTEEEQGQTDWPVGEGPSEADTEEPSARPLKETELVPFASAPPLNFEDHDSDEPGLSAPPLPSTERVQFDDEVGIYKELKQADKQTTSTVTGTRSPPQTPYREGYATIAAPRSKHPRHNIVSVCSPRDDLSANPEMEDIFEGTQDPFDSEPSSSTQSLDVLRSDSRAAEIQSKRAMLATLRKARLERKRRHFGPRPIEDMMSMISESISPAPTTEGLRTKLCTLATTRSSVQFLCVQTSAPPSASSIFTVTPRVPPDNDSQDNLTPLEGEATAKELIEYQLRRNIPPVRGPWERKLRPWSQALRSVADIGDYERDSEDSGDQNRKPGACLQCKELKIRCEYPTNAPPCKWCTKEGLQCLLHSAQLMCMGDLPALSASSSPVEQSLDGSPGPRIVDTASEAVEGMWEVASLQEAWKSFRARVGTSELVGVPSTLLVD